MCPICWATALASFGGLLAISVLSLAASDRWTLATAMLLGTTSIVHRAGYALVPWWILAALGVIVIGRIAYLLVFDRDRLLVVKLWGHACHIAARRCQKREA